MAIFLNVYSAFDLFIFRSFFEKCLFNTLTHISSSNLPKLVQSGSIENTPPKPTHKCTAESNELKNVCAKWQKWSLSITQNHLNNQKPTNKCNFKCAFFFALSFSLLCIQIIHSTQMASRVNHTDCLSFFFIAYMQIRPKSYMRSFLAALKT